METRTLSCRLHGGTFTIEAKRGRPPVKCGGNYPKCTEFEGTEGVSRTTTKTARRTRVVTKENTPSAAQKGRPQARPGSEAAKKEHVSLKQLKRDVQSAVTQAHERRAVAAQKPRKALTEVHTPEEIREAKATAQKGSQAILGATVALAMEAKAKLEAQGWTCEGRGWVDPVEVSPGKTVGGVPCAELIASRGDERITLLWRGDKLVDQQYSLWDMEQPHKNEMPEVGISSEFDEWSDKELVEYMAGKKVTWWNKLGKNKETAYVPETVKIAHNYNGVGDETPADRIVTIVDHGGTGYRSFRVGQLLKIG